MTKKKIAPSEMPLLSDENIAKLKGEAQRRAMQNQRVERMAAVGLTDEAIALVEGFSETKLKTKFRIELNRGRVQAQFKIAGKLYDKAEQGNLQAIIFYLTRKASTAFGDPSNAKDNSKGGIGQPMTEAPKMSEDPVQAAIDYEQCIRNFAYKKR